MPLEGSSVKRLEIQLQSKRLDRLTGFRKTEHISVYSTGEV